MITAANEEGYLKRYGISLQESSKRYAFEKAEEYDRLFSYTRSGMQAFAGIPQDVRLLLLLGFGDGAAVREIVRPLSAEVKVLCYEPDMERFCYACSREDVTDLIGQENFHLVVGDGNLQELMTNALLSTSDVTNVGHMFGQPVPGYTGLYPDLMRQMITAVQEILMGRVAEYATVIPYSRETFRNQLYALSVLHRSSLFGALLQRITDRDIPIVLVGAGPSLKKNAKDLCAIQGRALVIACTRAMETLEKYGAKADLVAMVDMAEGHDYCAHDRDRKYRILFHAQSAWDIQKQYAGDGIYFGFDPVKFPISGLQNEIRDFSTGGSVITCMFSVFLEAGFRRFILMGEDLAFSESGETHSGSYLEKTEETVYRTEGVDGREVLTRGDWRIFLDYFEKQIALHPEIRVIDATEGGTLIHGSRVMTMTEAIRTECDKTYPVADWLTGLPKGCKGDVKEVRNYLNGILRQGEMIGDALREALVWNGRVTGLITSGERIDAEAFRNVGTAYDEAYRKVIDEKSGEALKEYAADSVFLYVDRAQYVTGDEHFKEKLALEKELYEKLDQANEELTGFVSGLLADMEAEGVSRETEIPEDVLLLLVFGLGDGAYVKGLRSRVPANVKMLVYEPDPNGDASRISGEPDIRIAFDRDDLHGAIEEMLGYSNAEHYVVLTSPGYESGCEAAFDYFVSEIDKRIRYLDYSVFGWKCLGENMCKNELYALSQLSENYLFGDLQEQIPTREIPVILVAAGPSLKKNVKELINAEGKAIIVTIARAYPILQEMEIHTDLLARHVGLQNSDDKYYQEDKAHQHKVIASAFSGYDIQRAYDGNCIYYGFSDQIFHAPQLATEFLTEARGGSVATDVFEIFAAAGFRTIILVGQDLAYDVSGKSHAVAAGSGAGSGEETFDVEGIDGNIVKSRRDWMFFREYYEKAVEKIPDLELIDATEGGAKIRGSRIMTLKQAIEEKCTKEYPVGEWISSTHKAGERYGKEIGSNILKEQLELVNRAAEMLREIPILSDSILTRIRLSATNDEEYNTDCRRYDEIYHALLEGREGDLLCYYAEAELQDYISHALTAENDVIRKLETEAELFRRLREKCEDLRQLLEKLCEEHV